MKEEMKNVDAFALIQAIHIAQEEIRRKENENKNLSS